MSPSSEPFTLMERQRNQRRWAAKPAHQARGWGSCTAYHETTLALASLSDLSSLKLSKCSCSFLREAVNRTLVSGFVAGPYLWTFILKDTRTLVIKKNPRPQGINDRETVSGLPVPSTKLLLLDEGDILPPRSRSLLEQHANIPIYPYTHKGTQLKLFEVGQAHSSPSRSLLEQGKRRARLGGSLMHRLRETSIPDEEREKERKKIKRRG